MIGFLAEVSIASRSGRLPDYMLQRFFAALLRPTVSKLSLKYFGLSYGNSTVWFSQAKDKDESRLGQQIIHVYCLCRSKGCGTEALTLLSWPKKEAQDADIGVFSCVIVPFLKTLCPVFKEYDIEISTEVQTTCVSITRKLVDRCFGRQPNRYMLDFPPDSALTRWEKKFDDLRETLPSREEMKAFYGDAYEEMLKLLRLNASGTEASRHRR
ncbi:MAG: hypothetical protein Q9209_001195 [Squamulea sp. 1 TL-2023]